MSLRKKSVRILLLIVAGLLVSSMTAAAETRRTSLRVENLSCTSCLVTIEGELKTLSGALGMDADLRSGRVIVDHSPTLDHEKIAAAITELGYPAKVDWTATIPDQRNINAFGGNRYGSGCGGGCGGSGGTTGPVTWNAPKNASGTVTRTTLQVGNLSCTSCLANIKAELQGMAGTIGMNGFLDRGLVIVDHETSTAGDTIAAAISGLGYPARVLSAKDLSADKVAGVNAKNNVPVRGRGRGCNGSSTPCNATADSWKNLYKRYFVKDIKPQ